MDVLVGSFFVDIQGHLVPLSDMAGQVNPRGEGANPLVAVGLIKAMIKP